MRRRGARRGCVDSTWNLFACGCGCGFGFGLFDSRVLWVLWDSDGVGALVAIDRIGSAVRMPGWNGMGWDLVVYWACLIVVVIVVQIADATG
jgi:hypothetical protein